MIILIADDELRLRKVIALYMRKLGHDVIEAKDGKDAIRLAKETKPDIFILDIVMPDQSGIETLQVIKQDKDIAQIPTILLSASASETTQKEGIEAGADKYMTKPFSPKELLDAIEDMVYKAKKVV